MTRSITVCALAFLLAACATPPPPSRRASFAVGDTVEGTIGESLLSVTEHGWSYNQQGLPVTWSFERELVYSGRAGSTIKLMYREYGNATARPAYNQDLQYDLNVSDTVAFQGLRLKILNADNQTIRVKVLEARSRGIADLGNLSDTTQRPKSTVRPEMGKPCSADSDCAEGLKCKVFSDNSVGRCIK